MKVRSIWTPSMVSKLNEYCHEHTAAGKTLDWCFTNFPSGDDAGKYTNRYFANKAAYQKYVKGRTYTRSTKNAAPARSNKHITLSQLLAYQQAVEASGFQFIID